MVEIAYLNHRCIAHPRVRALLHDWDHDWDNFVKFWFLESTMQSIYVRAGVNNLPFRSDRLLDLGLAMPEFDDDFALSYADITDQRCRQLQTQLSDRPWIVSWSGGIDSTTVLASMIKNLSPQERQQVTVALNHLSIYENPRFFRDCILPNFKTRMISDIPHDQEHYVITGHLNDQICAGGYVPWALSTTSFGELGLEHDHQLRRFIAGRVDDSFADWFVEHMLDNIASTGLPIKNLNQFWWWMFFNHMWTCLKISGQLQGQHSVAWYDTPLYQQWSLHHNLVSGEAVDFQTFKRHSKQYIYDVDHNADYLNYKTKFHSSGLRSHVAMNVPLDVGHMPWALLTDGTRLVGDRDLDRLLTMLPQHIN